MIISWSSIGFPLLTKETASSALLIFKKLVVKLVLSINKLKGLCSLLDVTSKEASANPYAGTKAVALRP